MVAGLSKLCAPARVYLIISMIAIVIMIAQNYGNTKVYCLGDLSCNVSSTFLIFVIKLFYILFWTWILNLICRAGAPTLSWFLVAIPFILFFILIIGMMVF